MNDIHQGARTFKSDVELNKRPQTKEELKSQMRVYLKRSGVGDNSINRTIMFHAIDCEGHFVKTDVSKRIIKANFDKLVHAGFLNRICGVGNKHNSHTHRYECTIGKKEHSHLQCTTCGELTEFDDTLVRELSDKIAEHFEFERRAIGFQLDGTCKKCKTK
tara:strand:- start:243 stop:725 length:483 start_codon:yes stop_codon:yes gene_type:complete